MKGYAEREIFSAAELALFVRAAALVEKAPYALDLEPVRCHELVRAVANILELDQAQIVDGYIGFVEHSWLWCEKPVPFSALPHVLDVYTPGRIPQVQLIDIDVKLGQPYRLGPPRTDIQHDVVKRLMKLMNVLP